jgi:hypothetical protein
MKNIKPQPEYPTSEGFSGDFAGRTDSIKVFHCDTHLGRTGSTYASHSYTLTIHSDQRQLYSLQWATGFLIGIGNPISNPDYMSYLINFPPDVIAMLKENFKRYSFDAKNPLLFAVNNTMRLLPVKDGLFYICFPDNSYEISTLLYGNTAFSKEFLQGHEILMGTKIGRWLRKQFKFIEEVEKKWKNVRNSYKKEYSENED